MVHALALHGSNPPATPLSPAGYAAGNLLISNGTSGYLAVECKRTLATQLGAIQSSGGSACVLDSSKDASAVRGRLCGQYLTTTYVS